MAPTTLLMLCLLAATSLGAGIGASAWHLRRAGRHRRALAALRESALRERQAFDAMLAQERERSAVRHEEECRLVERERERAELAVARHDTLAAHAREQGRRVETLLAEVSSLEARCMKLQRDAASDRAGRRGTFVAPGRASGTPSGTSVRESAASAPDGDRLPVLNRRVGARAERRDPTAFPIGSDLEIPTLAESELPDTGDDSALDLLDTGNLFLDADDR